MNIDIRNFVILVSLCGLCVCACNAQTQLTGTVMDKSGAVIAGAAVTARNTDTGVALSAATNQSGIYSFPSLQAGPYEVSCELAGFRKFIHSGLVLETGTVKAMDIQLQVGAVTESVVVKASVPLLDAESSSVGQFIERTTVANMPIESRRSAALVRLMGNVVYRDEVQGEAAPEFTMGGGRSKNQMWMQDGAVGQNMTLGVPALLLNTPAEAIQEFKAEASNAPAEYGRNGSGLILMTTRSGTNSLHGAVYENLRNDKMDARTFFAPGKAPLRYNIFGTSLGGPIVRNKTFFFFNYEGARRNEGQTFTANVPHPQEVQGNFSARKDLKLIDPVSGQQFPNNTIPAARMDPVGQALAGFYPAPSIGNDDVTRAPVANFVTNYSNRVSQNFITSRFDHNLNDNNRLFVRFSYVVSFTTTGNAFPNRFADPNAQNQDNDSTNVTGSWIRNLKPTMINELRLSYLNRSNVVHSGGFGSGKTAELKLSGVDQTGFPQVVVTGLTNMGSNSQARIQEPIRTRQIVDTITWIKGKHQIKTGFEFRYSANTDINLPTAAGAFNFNDRATGSGTAALLLGWLNSGASNTTDPLATRSDFWGAFVQDDWKITPKLTLNLGVRWDMDTPRWEQHNRQSGFDGNAINPVAGVPGVITFAGRGGQSKYANDFDKNNLGPRFGFAYRVRSNWVVRGGYGIAYNGLYNVAVPNILANGFGYSTTVPSPDNGLTPAFLLRNGLPPVPQEQPGPGFGAVKVGQTPYTSAGYIQKNQVNGYAQQWNLSVQRTLLGNALVELTYMGNAGRKLGGSSNLNTNEIPLTDGHGSAKQDQKLRKFPQFSAVTWYSPVWGDSSYHSLNIKFEKRYSGGLNFITNFTWSKFLDNVGADQELARSGNCACTHTELHRFDKSYSGNNVPRRWVSSVVYELPFGRSRHWTISNRFTDALVGGWGLSTIAEFRDGAPYGATEQTNNTNSFSAGNPRPNLLRDPNISGDRLRAAMLAQYFDTSAFQAPAPTYFGNAARYVGFGPGFVGLDTSVHKRWALNERWNLQFRTDFFNVPNRPFFSNPATARGGAGFGRITATQPLSTGRLLQLSMRLEF